MKLVHLSVVLAAFSSAIASEADITDQPTASLAVVRVDSPPHSEALEQREFRADWVRELTFQLSDLGLDRRALEQVPTKLDPKSYLLADKTGFGDILGRKKLDVTPLFDTSYLKDKFNLKDELKFDADKFKADFKPLAVDLKDLTTSSQLDFDSTTFYIPTTQLTVEAPSFGGGHGSAAAGYYGATSTQMDMGAPMFYEPFAAPGIYPALSYFPPIMPCCYGFGYPVWTPFPVPFVPFF